MKVENIQETRRIQFSGGSTYIISLPKEWIKELKLNVGDSLNIVKNPNQSLTLFPKDQDEDQKTVAVIKSIQKESGNSIKRKIIAAYLSGYKTIQIKASGMKIQTAHSRSVRELVRLSMIGTEIVESSSDGITIQILTRLPELSFETALNRMYLMSTNMIKEAIEALEEADIAHADEVVSMDDEVDRFGMYIRRNLILAVGNQSRLQDMGLKRPAECIEYRTIVGKIERIADHAGLIAKRIKFLEGRIDTTIMSKIKKLSEKSLEIFEESIVAVQSHDFQKGENVAEKISKIIEDEKEIMSKIKNSEKNITIIRFVLEDLRRIAEYSSDIAEVAIDDNIHSVITEKII
ncbi:MAG: PhoU domain-containing protein [Nitrosarchaeum sp.]